MNLDLIGISALLLTVIIYVAVRLAIDPLLYKADEITSGKKKSMLVKLCDFQVLSNSELHEVIKLYENKIAKKKEQEEYQKYEQVLNELKQVGYFSEEEYSNRLDKLRKKFNVE